MTIFKNLSLVSSLLAGFFGCAAALPAFASVNVNSPANDARVSSPFTLSANSSACSSQPVSAMGFSLDGSSDTTIVKSSSIDTQVQAGAGAHTLHVKAWGNRGASCVTDVTINVAGTTSAATGDYVAPSNSSGVSSIQAFGGWRQQKDGGTSGWASGSMRLTNSPARSGNARQFSTSFSGNGGERYYVDFSDDAAATNFLYDAWVYVNNSAGSIANLEMDVNQVMENGQTVIYGFQCDGWSGTWDFTENRGSASHPIDAWVHSGAGCNPRSWARNAWHHVQISYSRNSYGTVTYHSVWLDGRESAINATVYSAFALGWGPTILTNFQVDGLGNGSATVYLDNLTIKRW